MEEKAVETQHTEELKQLFTLFDKECKGIIAAEDVVNAIRTYGIDLPHNKIKNLLIEIDLEDKRIDFEEFVLIIARLLNNTKNINKEIGELWNLLKKNNDTASLQEIFHIIASVVVVVE